LNLVGLKLVGLYRGALLMLLEHLHLDGRTLLNQVYHRLRLGRVYLGQHLNGIRHLFGRNLPQFRRYSRDCCLIERVCLTALRMGGLLDSIGLTELLFNCLTHLGMGQCLGDLRVETLDGFGIVVCFQWRIRRRRRFVILLRVLGNLRWI